MYTTLSLFPDAKVFRLCLDIEAAQHALDIAIGWFADPIYLGHYPPYMRTMLGNRLPEFTDEELKLVKGSSDFYGMNTYTTNLCREYIHPKDVSRSSLRPSQVLGGMTSSKASSTTPSPDRTELSWAHRHTVRGCRTILRASVRY